MCYLNALSSSEAQILKWYWQIKEGAEKKDEVIIVFPLHEKDSLFCVVVSSRR